MKFIDDFKTFAIKGNVMDMAIGVIIGGAFGKIVSSFVNDVVMPPLGLLLGGMDFADMFIELKPAIGEIPAVTLNYGLFINNVLDFLIIAFTIFMVISSFNRMKRKQEAVAPPPAPPALTNEELLLAEIRDLLKK